MDRDDQIPLFQVWESHGQASEPMELPALASRAKSGRVHADTWIYLNAARTWQRAGEVPELRIFFSSGTSANLPPAESDSTAAPDSVEIKLSSLRQISLLADFNDEQIAAFVEFMEIEEFPAYRKVVARGARGDAMYLILEGELRACMEIGGKETTLAVMGTGKFFGEFSVLDHGPRSCDVITNRECILLKISAAAFDRLISANPDLALPFLLCLSRSLVGRFRNLNKQYEDSIHFTRTAIGF